jgi:hypothetical protein
LEVLIVIRIIGIDYDLAGRRGSFSVLKGPDFAGSVEDWVAVA